MIDNCVKLEGTGDLDHYNCKERFNSSCPKTPYYDEDIYKNPACLTINVDKRCFVAEKDCPERKEVCGNQPTEDSNATADIIIYVFAVVVVVLAVMMTIYLKKVFKKREKRGGQIIQEKAVRAFLAKDEDLKIRHARCIILGCAQAGKTTLLKRLANAPMKILKKIKPTFIVDVHVNSFEVLEEENTIQSINEENNLTTIAFTTNDFQRHIEIEQEDAEQREVKHKVDKKGGQEMDVLYKNEDSVLLPNRTGDGNNAHRRNEEQTRRPFHADERFAVSKIMEDVHQLSDNLNPRITFLDFAGEHSHYAFHQIYLTHKTCYILVVDMTKEFDEKVPLPNSDEIHGSLFESWKYKDYYKFWLKSIDSFCNVEEKVIVVGTKAEDKTKEECQKYFKKFRALFDDHPYIQRHLHIDREFAIGFPTTGSKLEDLVTIKTCIAEFALDPRNSETTIRSRWAIFDHILQRDKIKKIIKKEDLLTKEISEEMQLREEEITEMLMFLHKIGKLLFYDEDNLKEKIILDIQWFVNAFKCIMECKVDRKEPSDTMRTRFQETGELKDKDLDKIWKTLPNNGKDYLDHKSDILFYMEKLGLLGVCHSEKPPWYYIPSMNKRKYDKNTRGNDITTSSILCFMFDEKKQVPIYIFQDLVLKCFQNPKWSISPEGKNKYCIYENMACFLFENHIVDICLCKFQIQVQVWLPEKSEIYSSILSKIETDVEKILQESKKRSCDIAIGYKCHNSVLNDERDETFFEKNKLLSQKNICNFCKPVHSVDKAICWVC